MTILEPQLGEVFTIRVVKAYSGSKWANNYEVQVTGAGVTTATLKSAAATIAAAERQFHLNWVGFERYVISTYVPDGDPYNPLTFISEAIGQFGARNVSSENLSLSDCFMARFVAPTGRAGRRLYRGVLTEADVVFGVNGHTVLEGVRTFVVGALNGMINSLPEATQLCLASGKPNPTIVRPVISAQAGFESTTKKLNNRYFRRNP